MSGQGNGFGSPGLLAGYLGKVQERAASLKTCPWCAAHGQTRALRSYRINLQKSITLCTDPQCLFPLVSRPLEDVLASLTPPLIPSESPSPIRGKRKSPNGSENPAPKRERSVDSDVVLDTEEVVSQNGLEPPASIATSKLTMTDKYFVQQERMCQSEPTDVVDKGLTHPDTGQVGAGGYQKDSDWPMPEEVQDEAVDGVCLPDEGLPAPQVAQDLSAVEKRTTQPAPEKVMVVSPLEEALPAPQVAQALSAVENRTTQPAPEKFTVVSPLEESLPAPQVAQDLSAVENRTTQPAPEKVTVVSPLEESLPAPQVAQDLSAVENRTTQPAPEKVTVVSPLEESLPAPQVAQDLSAVENRTTQPAPEKVTVVSPLEEALPAPQVFASAPEKAFASEAVVGQVPEEEETTSTLQDTVSLLAALTTPATLAQINLQTDVPVLEDWVSVPMESKPAPNQVDSTTQVLASALHEAVTLLEVVLPAPGEDVAMMEEVLPAPGDAVAMLEEVLSAPGDNVAMLEDVLPAPGDTVAMLEEVLPAPGDTVAMLEEVLPAPGDTVAMLEEVLPAPGDAVAMLEEVLPAPRDAVAMLSEVLPAPGEAVAMIEVLPAPGEAVAMLEEVLPASGDAVAMLEEVLPAPRDAVAMLSEVLPAPGEAVAMIEVLPAPGEAVAMLEEVLPAPGDAVAMLEEVLPAPRDAVPMLSEVLPAPGEAVAMLEEVLPAPGTAFAAVEKGGEEEESAALLQEASSMLEENSLINKEVLSVSRKGKQDVGHFKDLEEEVATPAKATSASAGDEKVLPALGEGQRERASESAEEEGAVKEDDCSDEDMPVFHKDQELPPEVVCRPCSVDLSQNEVPEDYVATEEYAEEDLPVFGTEDEVPLQVVCRPCSVDHSLSKVSDEQDESDNGPVHTGRKRNLRQLVSSEEERTSHPPPKKTKRHWRRKIPKYTPDVIPDFELKGLSEEQLVPVPGPHLFWRNESKLCWLDSLLVALVHCNTLRDRRATKGSSDVLPVWDLCERYDKASSLISAYQQTGTDGEVLVPSRLLHWVQMEMLAMRKSIFSLLQPLLNCKLGQKETPVFALPLLVQADVWAEPLFQHAFEWQFKCISDTCRHTTTTKCERTLTTFSKVVSDWHPLNAIYKSRCGKCKKSKQTRMFVLESLAPVFALHFVHGLPDNDVDIYSFTFQQHRYSVSTVIQYIKKLGHFVTWIRQPSGSWLEFDDLKYPSCASYTQLVVPLKEIHVVFWELESNRLADTILSETDASDVIPPEEPVQDLDLSLSSIHNGTAIVEALTVSDNSDGDINSMVTGGNTTIGSTTLLDTFEGLSHNDIITLTLVEVPVDSEGRVLDADNITTAAGLDGCLRTLHSTSEAGTPPPAPEITLSAQASPQPGFEMTASTNEIPSLAHGLAPQSKIDSDNVPERPTSPDTASEFLPDRSSEPESGKASRPVRGRKGRRSTKKTKLPSRPKVAAAAKVARSKSLLAEVDTPPAAQQPPSPHATKCSTTSPSLAPPLDPNTRWTYLLSRFPGQVTPMSPSTQIKPPPVNLPSHPKPRQSHTQTTPPPVNLPSHPKPRQYQQLSQSRQPPNMAAENAGVLRKKATPPTKPSLRKEDSESLLLKAADMYAGFQARSRDAINHLNIYSRTSSPAPQANPVVNHPTTTTTAMPVVTSLPVSPGVTKPHSTSSSRKCGPGSQGSDVSVSLTETETLRLKLLRKLKAKKRKLDKLNQILGDQVGGVELMTPGPESTDLRSPVTVSSSTSMYDSPEYQEFFADLLSPATTASNLSPDSTGFLDMLANNGQEGCVDLACGGNVMGGASQGLSLVTLQPASHAVFLPQPGLDGPITSGETFLDRLMSEPSNRQMDVEAEAFSALELFC